MLLAGRNTSVLNILTTVGSGWYSRPRPLAVACRVQSTFLGLITQGPHGVEKAITPLSSDKRWRTKGRGVMPTPTFSLALRLVRPVTTQPDLALSPFTYQPHNCPGLPAMPLISSDCSNPSVGPLWGTVPPCSGWCALLPPPPSPSLLWREASLTPETPLFLLYLSPSFFQKILMTRKG